VKFLADFSAVSTAQYMTSTWSSLWYAGIGNYVIMLYTLSWNFKGRRPWLMRWAFVDAFVRSFIPPFLYL
jgi:hypothetical protein